MTTRERIPFLDLAATHAELREELTEVFRQVLRDGQFTAGPLVEQFEEEFARFCRVRHCIAVSSGTDALRFALIGAGICPGDLVVTVPNTFIATTEAISQVGATPLFVDIDPETYNLDPRKLERLCEQECGLDQRSGRLRHIALDRSVTAVVPVHLYGQTCAMDPILEIAGRYGLRVIEDACQAHGAEYFSSKHERWQRAGSVGVAAAFSFYPTKNLGACGEAGAVTTNDDAQAERIRMVRNHGQGSRNSHDFEGYNGRIDSLQAGILRVKLRRLAEWNQERRDLAHLYRRLLGGAPEVTLQAEPQWARSVHHIFAIRVRERERLRAFLAQCGIETGVHYPVPLHLQPAYRHLAYRRGDFPVAERVQAEILSLPIYPRLGRENVERICREVQQGISAGYEEAAAWPA